MSILRRWTTKINRNSLRQLAVFSRRCLKRLLIEIWSLLSSKFSGKLTNLNIFISLIFCYCLGVLMFFFVQKENLNLDPCGLEVRLLCFALAPVVFTSAPFSLPLLPSVSLCFTLLPFAFHFPSLCYFPPFPFMAPSLLLLNTVSCTWPSFLLTFSCS